MAVVPACCFLKPESEEPEAPLVRCDEPATCMALTDIGGYVPACEDCAAGKQTLRRPE